MPATQQRRKHHSRPARVMAPGSNPVAFALRQATGLTAAELAGLIDPLREALAAFEQGHGTQLLWSRLCTAHHVGAAVERRGKIRGTPGVVQGLEQVYAAAYAVLDQISRLAEASQPWHCPALTQEALQALGDLVRVYAFALSQLSYGEYEDAFRRAVIAVVQAGGRVIDEAKDRGEAVC